jgi:hypothetical protein
MITKEMWSYDDLTARLLSSDYILDSHLPFLHGAPCRSFEDRAGSETHSLEGRVFLASQTFRSFAVVVLV